MVEIKTFEPEFIDKQVEIGQQVYSNYTFGAQSGKEQLQQSYSGENFDPKTRLYAFKEGEMVGFLPASIQPQQDDQPLSARLELPLVLEGHEDVIEPLFDQAIEILKEKNVQTVITRAGPAWGYTSNFAAEKGFTKENNIIKQANFDLNQWEGGEPDLEVVDLDMTKHEDGIRSMFNRFYPNAPEGAIENAITQLKSGTGINFLTQKIILNDGEVIGRLTAYVTNEGDSTALLGSLTSFEGENQEKVEQSLITAVMNELKNRDDISKVNVVLSGPLINAEDKFGLLNLEFEHGLSFYNLNLT